MKKLTILMMTFAFTASLGLMGCAKKGDTKEDEAVTEGSREMTPATSGGMQRMEEEEEAAAVDEEAPADPAAPADAPEEGGDAPE